MARGPNPGRALIPDKIEYELWPIKTNFCAMIML